MRIDDLALLSDCRTAALADREGSIVWFSPGRFDAASIFGRLLDPSAGHWTIRPRGGADVSRTYEGDGPVLRTTFRLDDGEVELTDALALRAGTGGHGMEGLPATHLIRRAACTRGRVELDVELVARPEYGMTIPHLERVESGWLLSGGRENFHLVTAVEHRAENDGLARRGPSRSRRGRRVGPRGRRARRTHRRRCAGRHDGRLALLAEHPRTDAGRACRCRSALGHGPAGPHLRADRRRHRGTDDLAAGAHRRGRGTGTTATPGCGT